MGFLDRLFGNGTSDEKRSRPAPRPTTTSHSKSFDDLMNDYYSAPNPYEQYKILQRAAAIAGTDSERLQVVLKVNQIKSDHGF